MLTKPALARSLRLIALISGSAVLAFVLYMLVAELLDTTGAGVGTGLGSWKEVLQFLLFPVALVVGLALAYRWELLGALLVLLSMAALCILRPDLLRAAFFVWALPAVFYLAHWALTREHAKAAH